MATINDLITALKEVPEDKRDLPIYVCDNENADNIPITSVSLFDQGQGYGIDNPLGINFTRDNETRPGVTLGVGIHTEDQAMDAINRIRARFDLVGTDFGRADVHDHVCDILEGLPSEVAEFLSPLYVEEVMRGYSLKSLRDIIISRGNEHLSDSAQEVIGIPTDPQFGPEYAIHIVSYDSGGETLRETWLSRSAESLMDEIVQAKKVPGAAEVAINGIYFTETGGQKPMGSLFTVWTR